MNEEEKQNKIEEPAAEPTETPAEDLRTQLQTCLSRLLRLQAEFENYKKRVARDVAALKDRSADEMILSFVTPYENLERALRSYATDQDEDAFVAGVEQIFAQFAQILEQLDVERIPSVGTTFDPALHEAMLTVSSDEEKNRILEELTPGYRRNSRILRASKVAVSRGSAEVKEEEKE